ncbi:MAG: formate dehydrogenase accessory sulfurtransferase FdhD [Acidimicrobiales bacterium]
MGRVTTERLVQRRLLGSEPTRQPDVLAVEEPLELRIHGRSLAVTMRTPGDDFDLAAGFLVSEGVVAGSEELASMRYCAGTEDDGINRYNLLDLVLAPGVAPPAPGVERAFLTTSSCGLCGKATIDAVRTRSRFDLEADATRVDPAWIAGLPEQLRAAQAVFEKTGGLHGAALFDATSGELLAIREDVGRHNAVDKVIGWAFRQGRLPLKATVLLVSGRASFELVQKAYMAGIPFLAAVSAPSSLAVDLALESGMTLIGFLRSPSMVVYSGERRLAEPGNHNVNETAPVGGKVQGSG